MAILSTILHYDWLQLRRSKAFWVLTILLLGIGGYAAYYGRSAVREQQQKVEALQHRIDSGMTIIRRAVQAKDTTAWDYEPFLKTTFCNRPDGLAGLSFGQRDLHKYAFEISEGTYYYNKYATGYTNKTLSAEIVNPEQQAAGHLDVSFVVVFLLPLYIILLSYNVLSSEAEEGTLPLLRLQSNGVQKVVYTRLLLRWAIAAVVCTILFLIGSLVNNAISDVRWLGMLGAAWVYSLFWISVVAVMISLHRSSNFNAFGLMAGWLLFCLLLPAAFNTVLNARHPVDSKTALSASVQKANSAVFDMKRRQVVDSFYDYHPTYNNLPGDTVGGGWYNPRWMRAVHGVLDLKVQPNEEAYQQQLAQRTDVANRLAYCSPPLLLQRIFNGFTGSNMEQMLAFDKESYRFFNEWNTYLDHRIFFNNNRLTKIDFDHLPQQIFLPETDGVAAGWQMLWIAVLSTLLWLMAIKLFTLKSAAGNKILR